MPKISVIIPVYNAESNLSRTLDCVFQQIFDDYEVICIDDGSTDNSLKILQDYAVKHNNMTIIAQENKRVSAARNAGLKAAKGDFIKFLDDDDIIESNALSLPYDKAIKTNADIVVCCHQRIINGEVVYNNIKKMEKYPKKKELKDLTPFTYYVWDKLFNKEFLINNKIYFNENVVASEDGYFMLTCLSKKPRLEFIPEITHSYIDNETCNTKKINWTGHSINTFYDILNSDLYKNADCNFKVFIINKYLLSIKYWFSAQYQQQYSSLNKREIWKLIKSMRLKISDQILSKSKFQQFETAFAPFITKIFRIMRKNNKKVIYLFGIKITIGEKSGKYNRI